MLENLLRGLVEFPAEEDRWLVLADWLEENDDPRRARLLRLHRLLLDTCLEPDAHPDRLIWQQELVGLLVEGVIPAVPREAVRLDAGLDLTLAFCPPGQVLMGSPESEPERDTDEPLHRVRVPRGFWMGIHPVTQAQWRAVMGNNPSHFHGDDFPVEMVSWDDCQTFLTALGELTDRSYRLPTEAEWEYACRAGTTTPFHFGADISTDLANYDGGYRYANGTLGVNRNTPTPVGTFPPNAWGLYDMHGNVWEWCATVYRRDPQSTDEEDGGERVIRGGAWFCYPRFCRSNHRGKRPTGFRSDYNGFRVILASQ